MSSDVISGCREAPAGEPMADLLRQLCAEEALSPEETAAVVRRAMCESDIAPVEWPSGLVPHLRQFVPGRRQARRDGEPVRRSFAPQSASRATWGQGRACSAAQAGRGDAGSEGAPDILPRWWKAPSCDPPQHRLEKDRDGRQHGRNEGTAAEPKADGHIHRCLSRCRSLPMCLGDQCFYRVSFNVAFMSPCGLDYQPWHARTALGAKVPWTSGLALMRL